MEEMWLHKCVDYIESAIRVLRKESDAREEGRIKAITITKLEEALLWANEIYGKHGNVLNGPPAEIVNYGGQTKVEEAK